MGVAIISWSSFDLNVRSMIILSLQMVVLLLLVAQGRGRAKRAWLSSLLVFSVLKWCFLTLVSINSLIAVRVSCCLTGIGWTSLKTSRTICPSLSSFVNILGIGHEWLWDQRIGINFATSCVLTCFTCICLLLAFHNVVVMESLWASFALVQIVKYILATIEVHQVSSCWSLITHRVEVLALCCRLIGVLGGSASDFLSSRLTPLPRIHFRPSARNRHRSWISVLLSIGLPRRWCSIVNDIYLIAHHDWSMWILVAV